jgi:hypothetical protein
LINYYGEGIAMKRIVFLLITGVIIFSGDVFAMRPRPVKATGEQANGEQTREEEYFYMRQRQNNFQRELDRVYEEARREHERQQILESRPEDSGFYEED